jgi:hypothetical protein
VTHLREILARRDVSKTDKYLLIVAMHDGPMKAADIRAVARTNGWREGASNVPSSFLGQTRSAIYLPNGWTVTEACKAQLCERGLLDPAGVLTPVTQQLEKFLLDVHDADKSRFVEEAIQCVRNRAYRAAIVLTWLGAVYLLYTHVLNGKLTAYNAEGLRQFPKSWKDAENVDDLAKKKESDFLKVLEGMRVLTPGEHKELKSCLDRRNTAGHPNSHAFEEVVVGAHIQTLISVVYRKY